MMHEYQPSLSLSSEPPDNNILLLKTHPFLQPIQGVKILKGKFTPKLFFDIYTGSL